MSILRLLVALLVAWLILADCALARHAPTFPQPLSAVMLGMLLGEMALVASWAACARRSWIVRSAVAWSCAALLAWPASVFSGPSWQAWAGLLLIYSAVVAFCWKLLHASGYHWEWPGLAAISPARRLQPHQFSLAWMMEVLTLSAATLGLGSWLALPSIQPWIAAVSAALLAPLVPLAMFALLVESHAGLWRVTLVFVLPLAVAALAILNGADLAKFLAVIAGTELLLGLLAGAIIAVAGGNLRFVGPEEKATPTAIVS